MPGHVHFIGEVEPLAHNARRITRSLNVGQQQVHVRPKEYPLRAMITARWY